MNSQEGKDVGNEGQSVIMRIPHSHSSPLLKFHQLHCQKIQRLLKFLAAKVPLLSEDTEATQVSGSKGAFTGKKAEFQPHWQKKYSWTNYNSVTNRMLCQYCSHIYKEGREVLQGAWISFSVSNRKKALDKMKAHEASAWHKMAKAKVEAEKQSQAEGSVILQLKQGKERWDEQTKQQNCILIKKLFRIMYFLCKQKIAHFSNFDEVVQLMVENGDDEVRKHLDTAPRNANYCSYAAIREYLEATSLWVQQGILRPLKEAAFYSILADELTDIATIMSFQYASDGLTVLVHQRNISWDLLAFLLVMHLQYSLR